MTTDERGWVPRACALPTQERPLRLAEFDELFATALRGQQRLAPTWLRWRLDPAAERVARELAAREAACCSFFTFAFAPAGAPGAPGAEVLEVDVRVPAAHVAVLDALAARAAAGSPA
jgi:hypothetical protein